MGKEHIMPGESGAIADTIDSVTYNESDDISRSEACYLIPPFAATAPSCIIDGDDRNASLGRAGRAAAAAAQFARIHRQRAVRGAEAQHRAGFFLCPGARRDLRLQAPWLGSSLFVPQGQRRR